MNKCCLPALGFAITLSLFSATPAIAAHTDKHIADSQEYSLPAERHTDDRQGRQDKDTGERLAQADKEMADQTDQIKLEPTHSWWPF